MTILYGVVQRTQYGEIGRRRRHLIVNIHSQTWHYVMRIFIVDDSEAIRKLLRTILEMQGNWIVCGEAENGLEGVEKAPELKPDVIVLDLSMPVMNGFQAARKLKSLMPHVPLVMFTSYVNSTLEREAVAVGIHSVVTKPEGAALVKAIRKVVHRSAVE